jgi:hypothetical protein
MADSLYGAPIDRLLTIGDPRGAESWVNFDDLGITTEHAPELIRMVCDSRFNGADSESLEVWAPLHAWRALGHLRAEAAVGRCSTCSTGQTNWMTNGHTKKSPWFWA